MSNKKVALEIVNPHAAGIDVGSRSHYVAIGQSAEDVKEFGVYAEDLKELADWLLENNIETVAMESTGTYWQNLFATLQQAGLKVILVNGKFTKNIQGKKTDVKDCQWLQKLHSRMQKYLRLLNLRLDIVVKDITGLTGLAIIEAICKGETNAEALSSHRHGNCRKSKEEIEKSLQSNGRQDYLFALQQEFEMYKMLQKENN